jgi:beta-lactamase regulating signal transducer with metallopeptidase domain
MNSWTSAVTHWLQHSQLAAGLPDLLLKSFVILLGAGGVCLCWRRGAASARHLVWLLAMGGVLGLPGLSGLVPAWQRPLWTVGTRANSENELTLTLEFMPAQATTASARQAAVPPSAAAIAAPGPAESAGRQRLATHFHTGWAALVLAAWLGGTGVIVLSVAVGRVRLRGLGRAARAPSSADWLPLLRLLCERLRVGRRVTLLQSADDLMPVTWGWWKPVILLPAEADAWSPERRRVVLLHELAHVKRWDCLTQMMARVACAVYWFNPLVWVGARRMCVERERACDDLVLEGGCKASDYAAHLLEIARTFRRAPQAAAIAMARSSRLKGRIAAIVDASRPRRSPRALLVGLCCAAVLAFLAAVAAQKPEADSPAPASGTKPWFDARLRAFFAAKAAQAHKLAEQANQPVAPEVWPYFEAGIKGDWQTATNLWSAMRGRAHQYEGTTSDESLDKVWGPILETDLAWEQFANWKEKYVLAFGNDIIRSIPPGSIYFGGTDPGRGVITGMSESHAEGKPFFTLTQNALADNTYLGYLRAMCAPTLSIPTDEDSRQCFQEYTADVQRRIALHELKPGEDVKVVGGQVQVSGQNAVMSINGLLAKIVFDRNPGREVYVEESFPLDWMYPYLTPNGLIMKVNRQPLPRLSEELVRQDHEYWSSYLRPMLGGWLDYDTPVAEVAAFVEKVYLKHDLGGFKGDPQFVEDTWAQKAFSKLRSSISGVYNWRITDAKTPAEKQQMTKEADFAFRQAYALCPVSPEAVFRYAKLLLSTDRLEDARLLAETTLKLDPTNAMIEALLKTLKKPKPKATTESKAPVGVPKPRQTLSAAKLPTDAQGRIVVDVPKLREALSTAGNEVQNLEKKVSLSLRYQRYPEALAGLDKLKETGDLDEAQTQAVNEVIEQVKQAAKDHEAAGAAQK